MITLEQAKDLTWKDSVYVWSESKGKPEKWSINGQVKTWKRDINRVKIPIKFGLYSYGRLDESNISKAFKSLEELKELNKEFKLVPGMTQAMFRNFIKTFHPSIRVKKFLVEGNKVTYYDKNDKSAVIVFQDLSNDNIAVYERREKS